MEFQPLGEVIYVPKIEGTPLSGIKQIEFNYQVTTQIKGSNIDLDITTKLFAEEKRFLCKARYRIRLRQISDCVKASLVSHMDALGLERKYIPESLDHQNSKT